MACVAVARHPGGRWFDRWLLAEAWRRARRRRALLAAVMLAVVVVAMLTLRTTSLFGATATAVRSSTILNTRWVETNREFGNNAHFMRFYVRKIEITRGTWKAWVGMTNGTNVRVDVRMEEVKAGSCCPQPPFAYWSGPALLWYRVVAGFPTNPIEVTAKATAVRPAYPKSLAPHKSWFGTFSGTLTGVPRNRFLHVGFGHFIHDASEQSARVDFGSFATNHEFRLPRR